MRYTPEFESFDTMNSTWARTSPNSCLLRRLTVFPVGPLRMAPVPGLGRQQLLIAGGQGRIADDAPLARIASPRGKIAARELELVAFAAIFAGREAAA